MTTPPNPSPRRTRKPWLLIFNCQVMGLANCLDLLCDEIEIEHYHPAGFTKAREDVLDRLDTFESILVATQLEHLLPEQHRDDARLLRVPTMGFDAYHPDICYLEDAQGDAVKGPMGDYHSLIAFAAFGKGLSATETLSLFCDDVYARMGYYERWDRAKRALLGRYRDAGLALDRHFTGWSRNDAFMYSINHVRIHCLRDLATVILEQAGKPVARREMLPHDNLAFGPVYPIYPEIGARLGVPGSYDFKPGTQYGFIGLNQFVAESFDLYRAVAGARVRSELLPVWERACATVEAHA